MKPIEFFQKYDGQPLDFDGVYGAQCVDVFKQYHKDVVGGNPVSGNAADYWVNVPKEYTAIANTPSNCPKLGDVVIWGKTLGPYGHIAICSEADKNKLICFGQNFPVGSFCHFQTHNYKHILGWLRPVEKSVKKCPTCGTILP